MNSNQTNQTDHQFECSKFSRLYRGGSGSFHPCQADWIACCMCHCLHPTDTQRAGQSWWLHKTELDFGETKMEVTKHQYIYIYVFFLHVAASCLSAVYAGPIARNICTCHNEVGRLEILRTHMRKSAPRVMLIYFSQNLGLYNPKKHTHTHSSNAFPSDILQQSF